MNTELQTALNTEVENFLPTIEQSQLSYVLSNGKYQQITDTDTGFTSNPTVYEVHEHVSSYGIGFTIIFRTTVDNVEYVKTVGYGVESADRTNDWQEVITDDLI